MGSLTHGLLRPPQYDVICLSLSCALSRLAYFTSQLEEGAFGSSWSTSSFDLCAMLSVAEIRVPGCALLYSQVKNY